MMNRFMTCFSFHCAICGGREHFCDMSELALTRNSRQSIFPAVSGDYHYMVSDS